jgi:hypothetical protein
MLNELIEYVRSNDRVCPRPKRWKELWELLPGRKRVGDGWSPPLPLILGAWSTTPALAKAHRLQEHIRYAEEHGALAEVDRILRALPETEWAHLADFKRADSQPNAASEGAAEQGDEADEA